MRGRSLAAPALAVSLLACSPAGPCRTPEFRRVRSFSRPYAGHWVVTRGDTLTMPEMGDRFRLTDIVLDTDTVALGRECHYRGRLIFTMPRAETLAVTWFGVPEHVTIFGWPVDLGPFGGISASWWGSGRDSLRGAVLFDEQLGVRVRPGATAQFVARRR
ncbi:MAG TPA: hypothetical protein VEO73_11940 [Gemmatimonadales bacterium]|nr:hypothetical protein [Gemmatimonadales bacterium]